MCVCASARFTYKINKLQLRALQCAWSFKKIPDWVLYLFLPQVILSDHLRLCSTGAVQTPLHELSPNFMSEFGISGCRVISFFLLFLTTFIFYFR